MLSRFARIPGPRKPQRRPGPVARTAHRGCAQSLAPRKPQRRSGAVARIPHRRCAQSLAPRKPQRRPGAVARIAHKGCARSLAPRKSSPWCADGRMAVMGTPPATSGAGAPALLLLAHGTRERRGAEEMAMLLDQLRGRVGLAEAGWLEDFAEPDAVTAAQRLLDAGAKALVTLPFLVLGAGHAKSDVPAGVWDVRDAFPSLPVSHGRVLGLHP